jgi:hypothetical protein
MLAHQSSAEGIAAQAPRAADWKGWKHEDGTRCDEVSALRSPPS